MNEDWECDVGRYVFSWHEGTLSCKDKAINRTFSAYSVNSWADYEEFVWQKKMPSLSVRVILELNEFMGVDCSVEEVTNLVKTVDQLENKLENSKTKLKWALSNFKVKCLGFMVDNNIKVNDMETFNEHRMKFSTSEKLSLDLLKKIEDFTNYSFEESQSWSGEWKYTFIRQYDEVNKG